ncbi:MAG: AbrB/MazE/SpoVT family DNA-binding domain-containing protein [Deltaproteobacteria bacterium]|nr:AbrB/MazE/SpoVT family DNA-binding domain-containing protein [Deltaproteobacteria bacterium]MBW2106706.1 AbrB/MazE/SpoVT family DNA-binding domain-containing protein [Deltaproteobacteria bacterium]RLB21160.1 MAG: AbrB/MazE/SpoVT family DNA-binding domain-containing protein [Deltaproteobacteria bacterium]HDH88112.1 AbrB/MazE/SpoVT family DNA-binding domain-containing protein [Desulfobacteraceae bacterium]
MEVGIKLSSKCQVVIPKHVREILEIGPGDELLMEVKEGSLIIYPKPKSYTNYMIGLHKDVWMNMDTDTYITKERESWKR